MNGDDPTTAQQQRMEAEERVQERIDGNGNRWKKVYFGGGSQFRNWLEQCKELGEVEVEEVDPTGFKCYEEDGEKVYRIWVRVPAGKAKPPKRGKT